MENMEQPSYVNSTPYYRAKKAALNQHINVNHLGNMEQEPMEQETMEQVPMEQEPMEQEIEPETCFEGENDYSSEESDEDDYTDNDNDIQDDIRIWALESKIKHCALTKLLHILKKVPTLGFLPSEAKTLLQTPRKVEITPMGQGEMWYNGVSNVVCGVLEQHDLKDIDKISLKFHIDGLPVFGSSKVDLWPILCFIEELPDVEAQVVAIYRGIGKPASTAEFFGKFVSEMKILLEHGLHIGGCHIKVCIKCFLCDLPGRSLIKGTVYFNHSHGCTMCEVIGEYESRRMSFATLDAPKRTDESFRERRDESHHRERSFIEELPVDMVSDFPVSDDLHLLHIGVTKRLITGWIYGSFKKNNYYTKWSASDTKTVSEELVKLNLYRPKELHRQIRDFNYVGKWKGTEWRTMLMYTGIVVLQDVLKPDVYEHFLLLFCAITICSTSYYEVFYPVAKAMLEEFVNRYIHIYGADEIVMNVHNLIHVVDDVLKHGPLPKISSYGGENALKGIKQDVRHGNRPLAQIARRVIERSKIKINLKKRTLYPNYYNKQSDLHERSDCSGTYNIVIIRSGFLLKNDNKNCWFMTKKNEVIKLLNVTIHNSNITIFGQKVLGVTGLFTEPIQSSTLHVYYCNSSTITNYDEKKLYDLSEIKCKFFRMVYKSRTIFIPLVHTFASNEVY